MRVVRHLDTLVDEVRRAAGEAASAFGDATVFCEPYVEHGRHVEVQVLADTHGNVRILGERDCSVQRRHQKVVEETPAPGLPEETRTALHEAARRAAEAVEYVGAGTVEFLVATRGGHFWFLEMNTRLQVEHPVTEAVTGTDLVAMQLAVAEGRRLDEVLPGGRHVDEPSAQGHAIEVRLYAEDPARGWQPQSGRLTRFEVPGVMAEFENPASYGIRLDSGFESGSVVGTHYDAMLAKVVSWAPTRDEAARRLAAGLRRARIHGVRTNRDLLVEVLTDPAFVAGEVSTDFLENRTLNALQGRRVPGDVTQQALMLFAAAVAVTERRAARRPVQRGVPNGWRNVVSAPRVTAFELDGTQVSVGWLAGRHGYRLVDVDDGRNTGDGGDGGDGAGADGGRLAEVHGVRTVAVEGVAGRRRVVVEHDGMSHPVEVFLDGERVDVESMHGHLALSVVPRFGDPADRLTAGSLVAPMPGSVVSVAVAVGDEVSAGQPVLVLEAMKMQHTVAAPHGGRVTEIPVAVGDQVAAGAVLAVVPEAPPAEVPSTDAPPSETPTGAAAAPEGESA
jgi:propionyl-CoA carboxylase alpha chain